MTSFGLVNDSNHQSECLVMVFNECHTLSQDSKNPTEKPVGETEKKVNDEYYCKCCFTFEDHENSIFLQCVVVPSTYRAHYSQLNVL